MTTKSKTNVIMIADVLEDGDAWHPREMLISASMRARDELPQVKKALVLFYDPANPDLNQRIKWNQAGMDRREILDLLTLAQNDILLDMMME